MLPAKCFVKPILMENIFYYALFPTRGDGSGGRGKLFLQEKKFSPTTNLFQEKRSVFLFFTIASSLIGNTAFYYIPFLKKRLMQILNNRCGLCAAAVVLCNKSVRRNFK